MLFPVQYYRYNDELLSFVKEDVPYFLAHFEPVNEPNVTHWLNFHSLEDKATILQFCDSLGIDKLIQEDLFNGTKRPRIEEYPDYVFFCIQSALPLKGAEFELKKERISFIMGDNFLISFQERVSDHFPTVRDRIENKRGKIRSKGPDFLLFRMLEAIVDNYSEVVEEIAENSEALDKMVVHNLSSEVLRKIEFEKRKLVELRKTVYPMKDLLTQIDRIENKLIIEESTHYFLELKDMCLSLIDEMDAQKQMLDGIANMYYAIQGQRMNEVMKVLTVTSAIFIPLTFIVGVYGMNFKYMPELGWQNGYYFAWGLMVSIALVLVVIFWKRGWMKRND
jgi:magnesium transporter